MTDLFFFRHGPRSDFRPDEKPILPDCKPYDPLVTESTVDMVKDVAEQMEHLMQGEPKNVYVHFSPYLRCCQTADLLVTELSKMPGKTKLHLLGDFALSEWIHDNMSNPPPFSDSNEAYQMYTPNVRSLNNRKLCLNFRPTTQLGGWNEPGLLYSDYLSRCRTYFQKLLATYDKPAHAHDVVVVVAHGYVINNFLTYFLGHPVFEEIPELGLNYARRERKNIENDDTDKGDRDTDQIDTDAKKPDSDIKDWIWTLHEDCLGALKRDGCDGVLNLNSSIVYYKTNFVRKSDLNPNKQYPGIGFGGLKPVIDVPRPSFKVQLLKAPNPLTPAAKDWDPRALHTFQVKSEFALKVMHDEAFKKAFDLQNHPSHPVSPDVSPTLTPTHTNSIVDLLKLRLNEEIFHPFRLKYLLALDILVHYLNSRINSHASLVNLRGSGNSSALDLIRPHSELGSPHPDQEDTNMNDVIDRLARVRSLQRKGPSALQKFGPIAEKSESEKDSKKFGSKFSLQFDLGVSKDEGQKQNQSHQNYPRRRRSSSVKFVPTLGKQKLNQPIFYNLASESSSSGNSDEDMSDYQEEKEYRWFGQNAI